MNNRGGIIHLDAFRCSYRLLAGMGAGDGKEGSTLAYHQGGRKEESVGVAYSPLRAPLSSSAPPASSAHLL